MARVVIAAVVNTDDLPVFDGTDNVAAGNILQEISDLLCGGAMTARLDDEARKQGYFATMPPTQASQYCEAISNFHNQRILLMKQISDSLLIYFHGEPPPIDAAADEPSTKPEILRQVEQYVSDSLSHELSSMTDTIEEPELLAAVIKSTLVQLGTSCKVLSMVKDAICIRVEMPVSL